MILRCFGSSSKGNCFALMNDTEILILDAGIKYKEVLQGIDYRIADVQCVFATHVHQDHFSAVNDWKNQGIPIFAPFQGGKQSIKFGGFSINAFSLPHDGVENRGVLVFHKDIGKLLYLTDFEYCKWNFAKHNVEHIIVEANYSKDMLDKTEAKYMHVLQGHASVDVAMDFINANKSDSLKNVVFAHLSKNATKSDEILAEANKIVPCAKYIATKGLEIELTQ